MDGPTEVYPVDKKLGIGELVFAGTWSEAYDYVTRQPPDPNRFGFQLVLLDA